MSQKFAEDFYRRSEEALEVVTKAERETWLRHPCTQALKQALYGDFMGIYDSWGNGEFTKDSVDATAQANAKALGQIQATEAVVEWIEGIVEVSDD